MRLSLFVGDIADAPADAICTSTNPHLSLVMGTGASVRSRGGFAILRECEALVAAAGMPGGLPPGSAHATSAGRLPHRLVIHCVASTASHRSSDEIIRRCVGNALAIAEAAGCQSLAMPVFASGHARVRFGHALGVIAETVWTSLAGVGRIVLVIHETDRVEEAVRVIASVTGAEPDVEKSTRPATDEPSGWWSETE